MRPNRHRILWLVAVISLLVVSRWAHAEQPVEAHPLQKYPLRLRMRGGVGFAQRARTTNNNITLSTLGGLQLVLPANRTQGYGLEVDYLQLTTRQERRFISLGLSLEQQLFGWLVSGISFRGAFALEGGRDIPFGITTRLAWRSKGGQRFKPMVALRNDWIFGERIHAATSLELGLEYRLDAFIRDLASENSDKQ